MTAALLEPSPAEELPDGDALMLKIVREADGPGDDAGADDDAIPSILSRFWDAASCNGMDREIFFTGGGVARTAKKICADCPIRQTCLEFGIATNVRYGIWGGMTRRERKAEMLRRGMVVLDDDGFEDDDAAGAADADIDDDDGGRGVGEVA